MYDASMNTLDVPVSLGTPMVSDPPMSPSKYLSSHRRAFPLSSPRGSVMSGSDLYSTHNADSDRCPKWSRTSEEGIEAGTCLDVDKHAGGP